MSDKYGKPKFVFPSSRLRNFQFPAMAELGPVITTMNGSVPQLPSKSRKKSTDVGEPASNHTATANGGLNTNSSLEGLQTDDQRRVLDTVAQIRKCGLESILSLPQLVVCGDQSAGKSSVLEALTEIPFPRNDNLCTRFATEIILRRATADSLTIKVIPDSERSSHEQDNIRQFNESITDFGELPSLMEKAKALMGIDEATGTSTMSRAFAKDVLSIEIEGPSRPQLTLVDLPGLIQTETKGVTKADVDLVAEITDSYITQPRTICLAVISATNDYANQGILTKVRKVDPEGERTLGIITKPDRLDPGSGSEKAFLSLARNEDIFFKLGWHVLKNRTFGETSNSFLERNMSEIAYFNRSNFKVLSKDCVGIESLRTRLSQLLFEHVKQELPRLREDLDHAMTDAKDQLKVMGSSRSTAQDCKFYLSKLSLEYYETCKAAVEGHYEGDYFIYDVNLQFSIDSEKAIRRLRALVQAMNMEFSNLVRTTGHKYQMDRSDEPDKSLKNADTGNPSKYKTLTNMTPHELPQKLSAQAALAWASQVLVRTRGRELPGNFNPLLIGELFWEQSSKWYRLAQDHLESVADICSTFLNGLLVEKCPKDIISRLWLSQMQESLRSRKEAAKTELLMITQDIKSYPVNYNHYYTDTTKKQRQAREKKSLSECIRDATSTSLLKGCNSGEHHNTSIDVDKVIDTYSNKTNPDMEVISCQEALDCLFAIYKVNHHQSSSVFYVLS